MFKNLKNYFLLLIKMNIVENIQNIYPGDFIITEKSKSPALVIAKYENIYLVSIVEYNGDYINVSDDENIHLLNLKSLEKLFILSNFGNWFYNQHKELYQEILIEYFTSIS